MPRERRKETRDSTHRDVALAVQGDEDQKGQQGEGADLGQVDGPGGQHQAALLAHLVRGQPQGDQDHSGDDRHHQQHQEQANTLRLHLSLSLFFLFLFVSPACTKKTRESCEKGVHACTAPCSFCVRPQEASLSLLCVVHTGCWKG